MAAPGRSLKDAETLAEAIVALRWKLTDRPGKGPLSHDKLARLLGTTRASVISWEKGVWPRDYLDHLAELGVPGRLLTVEARRGVQDRLEALEEEVARLRTERDSALKAIVVRLAGLEAAQAQEAPQPIRRSSQARKKKP